MDFGFYSGNVVVEYTYDAWGKVLSVTGSQANTIGQYNPFRYRSYYYDSETGFYYLQSRYYDPVVGRFINEDRFVATSQGFSGSNMFTYCGNNPVIRKDSSGEWWFVIILIPVVCPFVFTSCGNPNESFDDTPLDPAPKTTAYDTMEDAAKAGLIAIQDKYYKTLEETGRSYEHGLFIYKYEEKYYLTDPKHYNSFGSVYLDPDSRREDVVAAIHTHPYNTDNVFSVKDYDWVKNYNIPSYIVVVKQQYTKERGPAYYMPSDACSVRDYIKFEYFASSSPTLSSSGGQYYFKGDNIYVAFC